MVPHEETSMPNLVSLSLEMLQKNGLSFKVCTVYNQLLVLIHTVVLFPEVLNTEAQYPVHFYLTYF